MPIEPAIVDQEGSMPVTLSVRNYKTILRYTFFPLISVHVRAKAGEIKSMWGLMALIDYLKIKTSHKLYLETALKEIT